MSLEIWSYIPYTAGINVLVDLCFKILKELCLIWKPSWFSSEWKQKTTATIGELWFGEFLNSELFLTKLSGIDLKCIYLNDLKLRQFGFKCSSENLYWPINNIFMFKLFHGYHWRCVDITYRHLNNRIGRIHKKYHIASDYR